MNRWRTVTSRKRGPSYGNAYVIRDNTFVITVHRGSVDDPLALADFLADQFNKRDAKAEANDSPHTRSDAELHREAVEREVLQSEALRANGCEHVFTQTLGDRNRVCRNCGVVEFVGAAAGVQSFRERLGLDKYEAEKDGWGG